MLDTFTRHYLVAALWSSNDESTPSGGEPMDKNYGIEDFAPETLAQAIADCAKFQAENADDIIDDMNGGHDFWLTRNGHGAGFWDGDWPESGERLTEASRKFKPVELYVGDDGKIYAY